MRKQIGIALFVLLACQLGCSSAPDTFGDPLMSESEQTEALGKNWNEGQRLIEKGQKLKAKAEKLAVESRQTMTEAESMIAEGTSLMSASEEAIQANMDLLRR